MSKLSIFTALLLTGATWLSAAGQQIAYRKGYVVYSSGDTVPGWIGSKNWYDCPKKKVWFSADSLGKRSIILDIHDCRSFGVPEGEHFMRGLLNEDNYPLIDDCYPCCYEMGAPLLRLVFFRSLVEGSRFNLYEYKDDITERYAVGAVQPSGAIILTNLGEVVPYLASDGKYYNNYVYRRQLEMLLDSIPRQLLFDIKVAGYTREDLMDVVREMNRNPASYTYRPENHSRGNFFFSAGLAQLTFRFQGWFPPAGVERFNTSTVPLVKIGRDFNNSWKLPFLTLRTSLMAWTVNYKGYATNDPSGTVNYSLKHFIVEPSVGLLYSYLKRGGLELFLGIDGGLNISISDQNNLIQGKGADRTVTKDYIILRPYWFSSNLMAGAFLGDKKWEITTFYNLIQNFASDHGYSFDPRMWGVMVGYHFMKK